MRYNSRFIASVPFHATALNKDCFMTLNILHGLGLHYLYYAAGDVEQYSDEEYGRRGRGGAGERAGPGARGRRGFSR